MASRVGQGFLHYPVGGQRRDRRHRAGSCRHVRRDRGSCAPRAFDEGGQVGDASARVFARDPGDASGGTTDVTRVERRRVPAPPLAVGSPAPCQRRPVPGCCLGCG
jgi:hypothetical protein